MTDPARALPAWLRDLPTHLAWRLAERFTGFDRTLDADEPFILWADLVRAWQQQPPVIDAVLSSPLAAGLLLYLKAECEAQHARADRAEAQLAAQREIDPPAS